MPHFQAAVEVHAQPGVFDPAGQAVARALGQLGHGSVSDVRVGRHLVLRFEAPDAAAAAREVEAMCRELLANPVVESFRYTVNPDTGVPAGRVAAPGGTATRGTGPGGTAPPQAAAGSGPEGSGGH